MPALQAAVPRPSGCDSGIKVILRMSSRAIFSLLEGATQFSHMGVKSCNFSFQVFVALAEAQSISF